MPPRSRTVPEGSVNIMIVAKRRANGTVVPCAADTPAKNETGALVLGPVIPPVGTRFRAYRVFRSGQIPLGVLGLRGLHQGAKNLYGILKYHAGKNDHCWPSHSTLARELGVGVRTIQNYQTKLESARLIDVEQRGLRRSNRYFFLWHECLNGSWHSGCHAVPLCAEQKDLSVPENDGAGPDRNERSDGREQMEVGTKKRDSVVKKTCAFGASPDGAGNTPTPTVGDTDSSPKSRAACRRAMAIWMDESGTWCRRGWPPIPSEEPRTVDSLRADAVAEPLRKAFSATCEQLKRPFSAMCKSEFLARWIEEDGLEECIAVAEFGAKRWELLQNAIPPIRGWKRSLYMTYCVRKLVRSHLDSNRHRSIDNCWKGTSAEFGVEYIA